MRLSFLKYVMWAAVALLTAASCADEPLTGDDRGAEDYGTIGFSAITAVPYDATVTRSSEEDGGLYDPLVLYSEDGELPLYLHTYEHVTDDGACGSGIADMAQTRGLQVNTPDIFYLVHNSFGVYAEEDVSGVPYFALQSTRLTPLGNRRYWTTNQTQRWPGHDRLNFGAVAPWGHQTKMRELAFDFADNVRKRICFGYTAQKSGNDRDAESQVDLMLASSSFTREETADYGYRVPLHFNHALSSIKFAVRDVLKGEVVSIRIKGVYGAGECEYTTSDLAGFKGSVTWKNHTGITEYVQMFNHSIEDGNFNPEDDKHDVVLNTRMPEKTFMLIPQQIPDDATIEIVIKRDNVVSSLAETITLRGRIKDNLVTEWKPGHEYIYTISTSRDNWVYVFNVTGNSEEGYGNIYVYSPNADEFVVPQNTGYYSVTSYRYRANNQSYREILPWTATFGGSESYEARGVGDALYEGKYISPSKWISDQNVSNVLEEQEVGGKEMGTFRGNGSLTPEKRMLDFYPHYLVTDWEGDKKMQNTAPYEGYTMGNPYDLSTFGSTTARSTANCYIVDRGGWYCLPLVYGNGILKGGTNTSAYKSNGSGQRILAWFKNHAGNNITSPQIAGGSSAALIWQDSYNMVSQVELAKVGTNSETMLRFYVDNENLQQGNAIIAVKNSQGAIMWSWHIWATEHWLGSDGKPQTLSARSGEFTSATNVTTGIRERGDAKLTTNMGGRTFYMSPYNLGWCDPKNVIYLKRKSNMDFIQYMPDKTAETGKTANLGIVQQGETVNYKIGNNTYYQWGRKDPQVGFADRNKNFKASFGTMVFGMESQVNKTLKDGILKPHMMFAGKGTGSNSDATAPYQDWTSERYWNLWNNSASINVGVRVTGADAWSHVKTIYDPCPVGYVVPNLGVWHVIGGQKVPTGKSYSYSEFSAELNGVRDRKVEATPDGIYLYKIYGTGSASDVDNIVYLAPTGNRWYSSEHTFTQAEEGVQGDDATITAGKNFNLRLFYGWSNRWSNDYSAYTGTVGIDGAMDWNYYVAPAFAGRRAMARPVRAIRDPNF